MTYTYPLALDSFGSEEINAGIGVLQSGKYTMGARVKTFEERFAKFVGAKHAVMVNSGSSANLLAMELALRGLGAHSLQPGDEIFVPALSWPTTVWPIVQLGLKPVFVDIDPSTLAVSLKSMEKMRSPKTRGLFLIHVLGRCANMREIVGFCQQHGIALFEDCCETLGAGQDGRHVGTFGTVGTFSHFFSHHLTTIEGGTIVTDDARLADNLRSFRAHGWVRDRSDKEEWTSAHPNLDQRFLFISTGYNVRPMELNAAIGLVQIEKLPAMLERRRKWAKRLHECVRSKLPWLTMLGADDTWTTSGKYPLHTWMNISFQVESGAGKTVKDVQGVFERCGVETRPIIAGNMLRHPACKSFDFRADPDMTNADRILTNGFMIGCHQDLSDQAYDAFSKAVHDLAK